MNNSFHEKNEQVKNKNMEHFLNINNAKYHLELNVYIKKKNPQFKCSFGIERYQDGIFYIMDFTRYLKDILLG